MKQMSKLVNMQEVQPQAATQTQVTVNTLAKLSAQMMERVAVLETGQTVTVAALTFETDEVMIEPHITTTTETDEEGRKKTPNK
jgi:hypothetical protein